MHGGEQCNHQSVMTNLSLTQLLTFVLCAAACPQAIAFGMAAFVTTMPAHTPVANSDTGLDMHDHACPLSLCILKADPQ